MKSLEAYEAVMETTTAAGKEAVEMDCCCLFSLLLLCVCVCVCPHIVTGAHVGQKRASESLELGLKVVVNNSTVWVLGTELRSWASAASSLNHSSRLSSLSCSE